MGLDREKNMTDRPQPGSQTGPQAPPAMLCPICHQTFQSKEQVSVLEYTHFYVHKVTLYRGKKHNFLEKAGCFSKE